MAPRPVPRLGPATAPAALAAALAVLVGVGLGGCGSDDRSASDPAAGPSTAATSSSPASPASSSTAATPSRRPAPADWPACGEVWQDGARLPAHYRGCAADGAAVPAHQLGCSSGQFFVLYADHYWAVRGGTIQRADRKLANSPAYTADVATCRG